MGARQRAPSFSSATDTARTGWIFEQHQNQLAPDAIYRAKVWGRVERDYQLDFVDAGFLPVIEAEAGQKLTGLIEHVVSETKQRLGWKDVSETDGHWLLQSTFWLLAAKILQDKSVRGFAGLDLAEVEDVFARLAIHYHSESPRPIPVGGQRRREALVAASHDIGRFGNCGAISTEALAFLYESALIDRTTRIKLGTHTFLNKQGKRLVNVIRLNHPRFVEDRLKILRLWKILAEHAPVELQRLMAFPENLPDLSAFKPPRGNRRPEGISESCLARRNRGDLPKVC